MRKPLIIVLLATMLSALGHAQTVNICGKTAQVRYAIMQAIEADDCAAVDSVRLAGLRELDLAQTRLTALQAGDFDGLTSLQELDLAGNQLTALPDGIFDGLTSLRVLSLAANRLTALPDGAFDSLASLETLNLGYNHLVGLTRNDPLFSRLPDGSVNLDGQAKPRHLVAALPLLVSAADTMLRFVNQSDKSGVVRILAFDDAGAEGDTAEFKLGVNAGFHFNSGDLQNGNPDKGIAGGIGRPLQGDWRLGVETALDVLALAHARREDGFLTAIHDVLQRDAQGRLVVPTFNPASNTERLSKLRLINTAEDTEELIAIYGYDDTTSPSAGPVTLTLAAGESRTLSAVDLEEGADGLTGTLGDGRGKWYLLVEAGPPVVGMSLLDSASGHLSNLSTLSNAYNSVPLLLSSSDPARQGFVRIVNESAESGTLRVSAFDDAGVAADPIELPLAAHQAIHFNADDLENGNAAKGIEAGIGSPVRGHWRLQVETVLDIQTLAYMRTGDASGPLTAMHDLLQRDAQERLLAPTFNSVRNTNRVGKLRLSNTGADAASLSIEGVDDAGDTAGPVTLTLAAGESRTFSTLDLAEGADGLTGTLGAGWGKRRLFVTAGQSVVGMSLLESASGHLTNISTMGTRIKGQ